MLQEKEVGVYESCRTVKLTGKFLVGVSAAANISSKPLHQSKIDEGIREYHRTLTLADDTVICEKWRFDLERRERQNMRVKKSLGGRVKGVKMRRMYKSPVNGPEQKRGEKAVENVKKVKE